MKKISYILLLAVSSSLLFSCNKDKDHDHDDLNSASITLTSPAVGGHIHHNDTMQVRGNITSVKDIHGYHVKVVRNTDNSAVFSYEDHYHGTNKNLNVDWVCDLNENVQLKVTVTAILDHDGNTESKSVLIQCEL